MLALSKRLFAVTALGLAVLCSVASAQAAGKDRLVVDLVNEPSSLDPHVQWNPDSYYVYRNIFDNLRHARRQRRDRSANRHVLEVSLRHADRVPAARRRDVSRRLAS